MAITERSLPSITPKCRLCSHWKPDANGITGDCSKAENNCFGEAKTTSTFSCQHFALGGNDVFS